MSKSEKKLLDKVKDKLSLKDLKGAYLAMKQGDTLERISRPTTREEIESLGDMGPRSTGALASFQMVDKLLNELYGTDDDTLTQFAFSMYRGSAQRNFTRGAALLEAIGQIGAHIPEQPKRERGPAVETDWNE